MSQASPGTQQPALAPYGSGAGPVRRRGRWRKVLWLLAVAVALAAVSVAVEVGKPFASAGDGRRATTQNPDPTGLYTVHRGALSSQTQVPATLAYAGNYSIAAPSGVSAEEVAQAKQTVTEDRQTLSADEQTESATATADNQTIAVDQANLTAAQSTLSSDQTKQSQDCAGSGASSAACTQSEQKVSQDQTQLTQAQQQLDGAQSSATLDHDQDQAKVQADETTLQGDQATLASLQASEVNPATTYTSLPKVGEIIKEDQAVYSLSDEPVPLLYGSIPAYRAFYLGMSGGADVGELTKDLIALGFGAGLTPSNDYSSVVAAAVKRWQRALGLPATGEILLGQVVFEPGPIRVSSVTPSIGASAGGGGGTAAGASAPGGEGGAAILSATSTTRQVSIALDASAQSEVAVGDQVTITLPDDKTTPGVISSVGTVATAGQSGGSPTIAVLVTPTDPATTGEWDQAPVTVTITTGRVNDALVVPVAALRAEPGGRYAVEVVGAGGVHRLVPVNLGLFDDANGMVQVTATSLAPGQRVVVPEL